MTALRKCTTPTTAERRQAKSTQQPDTITHSASTSAPTTSHHHMHSPASRNHSLASPTTSPTTSRANPTTPPTSNTRGCSSLPPMPSSVSDVLWPSLSIVPSSLQPTSPMLLDRRSSRCSVVLVLRASTRPFTPRSPAPFLRHKIQVERQVVVMLWGRTVVGI